MRIQLASFVICLVCMCSSGNGQMSTTLILPKVEDIKGFEYWKSPIYSTGSLDFKMPQTDLFYFFKHAKVLPFDSPEFELSQIAPFSPPEKLSDYEKRIVDQYKQSSKTLKDWISLSTSEFGSSGAFSTSDHQIYFWRKDNDRVLFISKWTAGCYLLLPAGPETPMKTEQDAAANP